MAIAVTASLVGITTPRLVQIEVTGLTVGEEVTITGSAGVWSWPVRGGTEIIADSSQVIRVDNLTPLNTEITYTVRVEDVEYTTSAITVPFDGDYALMSLDGENVVSMVWLGNGDPVKMSTGHHVSKPHRSSTYVARWSSGGAESGQWELATQTTAETVALQTLLASGAPLVMRTSPSLMDFKPARIVVFPDPERVNPANVGQVRVWTTPWFEVGDPFASDVVDSWTCADMDAVILAQGDTCADLDTFIIGLGDTCEAINAFDWAAEAAS